MRIERTCTAVFAGALGVVGGSVAGGSVAVVSPAFDLLVSTTPDVIVNATLEALGSRAEQLLFAVAICATGLFLAAVAYAATQLGDRLTADSGLLSPISAAVVGIVTMGVATDSIGAAIGVGIGVAVGVAADPGGYTLPDGVERPDRRRTLGLVAGTVGTVLPAAILGRVFSGDTPPVEPIDLDERDRDAVDSYLAAADAREFDLPGSPGLVSRIGEFYTVDINYRPPNVVREEWTLSIDGELDRPQTFDFESLSAEPFVTEPATLRCIGEPIDGSLMDTAIWTGVPLSRLLDRAGLRGEHAVVHGVDGYYERLPVSLLEDALLVVAMNGQSLPREHGYPVRIAIPGTWGKINTKWIERIEILSEPGEGYWTNRGWNGTAPMRIVAKVGTVERTERGILVGGHAYAGRRGISAVELSIDGGESWTDAELSEPVDADAAAVSRQWRYEWISERREYDVVVRAIDGDGEMQDGTESGPFPDGASGWVTRRVRSR